MTKVLIRDPAPARRDGWFDLDGKELRGNISRVFLTDIPISTPTSTIRQVEDYTCGPTGLAQALNKSEYYSILNWMQVRGLITSQYGTEYEGIVRYLSAVGHSCAYDGIAYDGSTACNDKIANHLHKGYKVIVVVHKVYSNYFTNGGHYIVMHGIDGSTPTPPKGDNHMFTVKPVQHGSQGKSVLLLEEILKARGLYTGALDSSSGNGLVSAINAYQTARRKQGTELGTNGKNDGICGSKMWADILGL